MSCDQNDIAVLHYGSLLFGVGQTLGRLRVLESDHHLSVDAAVLCKSGDLRHVDQVMYNEQLHSDSMFPYSPCIISVEICSTIFDNPKVASLIGVFMFIISLYGGFFALIMDGNQKTWLCLLGPSCYSVSLTNLAQYESRFVVNAFYIHRTLIFLMSNMI